MELLERCRQEQWRKVAFIGMAKHAGKTTALNGFLHELAQAGESVGLLSVGVDGERLDAILGVQKPRVYVEEGTIVASAERALLDSDAHFDWISELPIPSPLGPVMIARVTLPGTVVLAGIRQRAHVKQVVDVLQDLGCSYILVDGAFDRIAAASPSLVDAAVLAVGAVLADTPAQVAQHAQPVIARFALPKTRHLWQRLFSEARAEGHAAIAVRKNSSKAGYPDLEGDHAGAHPFDGDHAGGHLFDGDHSDDSWPLSHLDVLRLPAHAALFDLTRQMGWSDDTVAVYIPGAVTDGAIEGLLRHPHALEIVADHPAQVLLSGAQYRKLLRHGHQLTVWNRLPLAAIAVNPHHISGFDMAEGELLTAVEQVAVGVPVYNPLHISATRSGT